jgi:hypothetical protein
MREVSRSFCGLPCPGGSASFNRPEMNARTELGQASLAVALVGSPRASRIPSQAPAFYAGVLDLIFFPCSVRGACFFCLEQLYHIPLVYVQTSPDRWFHPTQDAAKQRPSCGRGLGTRADEPRKSRPRAARFYANIVKTLESPSIGGMPLVCVRGGATNAFFILILLVSRKMEGVKLSPGK